MSSPFEKKRDVRDRRLYLCTGDRPDMEAFLAAVIRGGVDVVQLRDKDLDDRALLARAAAARRVCGDLGVPFILNDRPDLALAVGADGVHVGQRDAPPCLARRILGAGAVIGLSTHSPGELTRSIQEDVDYISVGPVVPTPTKPGRTGTGLAYVAFAAGAARSRPFFVTGGVTPEAVAGLVAAGAERFVVVRYLTGAGGGPPRADMAAVEATARALRRSVDAALDASQGRRAAPL